MKRLLVVLIVVVALIPSIALADHALNHVEVTSSQVRVQSVTVVLPPDSNLSPIEWRDVPNLPAITTTGRQFKAAFTCAATNSAGMGFNYRLQIGVAVDGVLHGEVNAHLIPQYQEYYESLSAAGSLIENIHASNGLTTHTFKLVAWGIHGKLAVHECNMTVEAYE